MCALVTTSIQFHFNTKRLLGKRRSDFQYRGTANRNVNIVFSYASEAYLIREAPVCNQLL